MPLLAVAAHNNTNGGESILIWGGIVLAVQGITPGNEEASTWFYERRSFFDGAHTAVALARLSNERMQGWVVAGGKLWTNWQGPDWHWGAN